MSEDLRETPVSADGAPGESGVSPTPAEIAVRSQATPAARWVFPTLALTLVAGVAIGLIIGWSLGRGASANDPAEPATSAPASPTTNSSTADDDIIFGTVEVSGDPFPIWGTADEQEIVGTPVPEITGHDFSGNAVAITNDGRAKIILLAAHWCPYCQETMPVLLDWYTTAELPDNVDVYSIIIWTNPDGANFPPSPWLESENWSIPVIVDDVQQTVADAIGVSGVPFWALVYTDGTLYQRGGGQLSAEALDEIALTLSEGPE